MATGFPPYGSFGGGPFDVVDNANRNVHFDIPIINKAGLGMPFNYKVTYDSSVWSPVSSTGQSAWTPVRQTSSTPSTWGWGNTAKALSGYVTFYTTVQYCSDHNGKQYPYEVLSSWYYYDGQDTGHAFPGLTVSNESLNPCVSGNYPPYSGSSVATDGSGWQISASAGALGFPPTPSATEYSVSGVAVVAPFFSAGSSSPTLTAPNGNVISFSGSNFTDTLGATALTVGGSPPTKTTYTYTGPGGSGTVTFKYTQQTVQTNFGCPGITEYPATPIYLVSEIDLPDNTKYTLNYETTYQHSPNVTGRIASITLPTGGTISYVYTVTGGFNDISCYDGSTTDLVRTTPDGAWTYEIGSIVAPADPQGNQALTTMSFQGVYETERDIYQKINGNLLETVNTCYNSNATSCNSTAVTLPITQRTVTTTLGALKSQTQTFYNSYGLPIKVDEYDFGNPGVGNFKRETMICYASLGGIQDRPSAKVVYSATGNPSNCSGTNGLVAETTYAYDVYGNLQTENRYYASGSSSYIQRSFTYGGHGVLTGSSDFKGHSTGYSNFTCGTNPAFPTTITLPITSQTYTLAWDCGGGVLTSIQDPNGQKTAYQYDTADHIWRVIETDYTDASQNTVGKTTITYNDTPPNFSISTCRYLDSSHYHRTTQVLDGLGRIAHSQDNTAATYVDTTFDGLGRVLTVSNPYATVNDKTYGLTTYSYDALNRSTAVQAPDGSATSTSFAVNSLTYCSTVTDPATKARTLCSDGLGRITSVTEDPSSLIYLTTYTYDLLDDLKTVTQGSQTPRAYNYDWLGRLTSAQTPEAGTTTYSYAVSGNPCSGDPTAPCSRTDARNITTTYTYNDNLNRLTSKSYNDTPQTPPASFFYDQAPSTMPNWTGVSFSYAKGRLVLTCTNTTVGTCTSPATATAHSYDPVGRIKDYWQCNPSNCNTASIYNTHYNYDWAGDVTSWNHPGLINITNSVNSAQQVYQVQTTSQYTNLPQTLAQNITYTPWGAVGSLQNGCTPSGSCTNAQETYQYNKNLQPWVISLTAASGAGYCLEYNYYSTWTAPSSCPAPGSTPPAGNSTNNGNVMGYWYNDSVNTSFNHTASYSYDNVNRLTQATATGNSTYSQIYSYTAGDGSNGQYGNMTCTTGCTPANWTLDPGSNHLTPLSSYTYDAAGDLTKDSSNPTAHTYQWDAEGRVASVDNGSTWSFTYNAMGHRVQWAYPGGANQHMFDPNGGWLGVYGALDVLRWGDGAYAWYTGTETYFNHINNISTTSMLTNHSGAAVQDILYYPWGQMPPWHLWGGGGANFAELPYQDGITDTNITMFRFHSPAVGRWLSPDPVAGDITNPQSLNRYAYVLNNPTSLTDPLGLSGPCGADGTDSDGNACTPIPEQSSQSNLTNGGGSGDFFPTFSFQLVLLELPPPPPNVDWTFGASPSDSGFGGLALLPLRNVTGIIRSLAPNVCTGDAKFSAVGPEQATDLGALAAFGIPGHQTGGVAVNPAIFGLRLPGGQGNVGVQRQLAGISPFISIYPAALKLYGGPQAPYFISDIGDKNIRNSATPRFDLYGFPTLKSAQQFGTQTVPTTIFVTAPLPCPTGFSGGQQ